MVAPSNGGVTAILVEAGGKVVVGGSFTNVHGVVRGGLARLASDGRLDETFEVHQVVRTTPETEQLVSDSNGNVFFGGAFTITDPAGLQHTNLVRWLSLYGALDDRFQPTLNGLVAAMALQAQDRLLIGGSFSTVNGSSRPGLARIVVNTSDLQSLHIVGQPRNVAIAPGQKCLFQRFRGRRTC